MTTIVEPEPYGPHPDHNFTPRFDKASSEFVTHPLDDTTPALPHAHRQIGLNPYVSHTDLVQFGNLLRNSHHYLVWFECERC